MPISEMAIRPPFSRGCWCSRPMCRLDSSCSNAASSLSTSLSPRSRGSGSSPPTRWAGSRRAGRCRSAPFQLISAAFLLWSERRFAALQEAIIGVVFVFAASAELILLGFNPHGAEHLKDLLVGQILWVEPRQFVPVAVLYAGSGCVLLLRPAAAAGLFYLLFAVTITASVQLIGVFLVFASLILPALAAASCNGIALAFGLSCRADGLRARSHSPRSLWICRPARPLSARLPQ